jgi:hypothetical protein
MAVHALVGDDGELGRVDRIGALAQDLALRALLAATKQKPSRVLEVRLVLGVVGAKHLRRAKRRAVAREHIGNLALPDGHEIGFVNPVHEGKKDMEAAAQHFGLITGLAVQRDEPVLDRPFRRPELFDDADLIVRDVPKNVGYAQQDDDDNDRCSPNGRLDPA